MTEKAKISNYLQKDNLITSSKSHLQNNTSNQALKHSNAVSTNNSREKLFQLSIKTLKNKKNINSN